MTRYSQAGMIDLTGGGRLQEMAMILTADGSADVLPDR